MTTLSPCSGDMLAALLLGWMQRKPRMLQDAVLASAAALQAVLKTTADAAGPAARSPERTAEVISCCSKRFCLEVCIKAVESQQHVHAEERRDFAHHFLAGCEENSVTDEPVCARPA